MTRPPRQGPPKANHTNYDMLGISSLVGLTIVLAMQCLVTEGTSSNSTYIRGCYFTNWAQYRNGIGKYDPSNYVPGICTHIFYAFVKMDESFQLQPVEWNDQPSSSGDIGYYQKVLNLKQQQPDLKILLSFGGWNFCQANAALLSRMASTAENRAVFINSVITYVRGIDYDGFDVDWEYPTAAEKNNFAALITEMRAAFEKEALQSRKPRLLLTAAVAAGVPTIDAGYDGPQLAEALDFFNVMTYDYHGSWEMQTGFNSPLYDRNGDGLSIRTTAEQWNAIGVPKSKLIIGLAAYGRGWILSNPGDPSVGAPASGPNPALAFSGAAGTAAYYEVCDLIENQGYKETYDESQQAAVVTGQSENQGTVWIGYDNVRSFNAKLDWIKQNGFGGAFVWTLDFDDFQGQCASSKGTKYPLLSAMNAKLSGLGPQTGPNPTPKPKPKSTLSSKKTTANPKLTNRPSVAPTANPSKPFQCPGQGIYADPSSCKSFYVCDQLKRAGKIPCPPGLDFNESAKYCDWPNLAKCKRG